VTDDRAQDTGYQHVDAAERPDELLVRMDEHAAWESTVTLRGWTREHLHPATGQRLLDVGCGLGDGARALAGDLGPAGEVVGIDASTVMLEAARTRWDADCPAYFVVGDAQALALPDASFNAARSERMLQWLPDPAAAVAELARVVRPGGRIALIDTDWGSLDVEIGDPDLSDAVRRTMSVERRRPSRVGRRLADLAHDAGLGEVAQTQAVQRWTEWDPDASPSPIGFFPVRDLADDALDAGELSADDAERFMQQAERAAREGRFVLSLTAYAIVAVRP
jgi:SAM-dependent methyltransferase